MTTFRPQLAVACKDVNKLKFPLIAEPKLDGVRCVCVIENGKPSFWSRDGKPFVNFEELEVELEALRLADMIIDGEILAKSKSFDDTISRTRSHRGVNTHIDYEFHVFDILNQTFKVKDNVICYASFKLKDRKNNLLTYLSNNKPIGRIKIVPFTVIQDTKELCDLHIKYCAEGYEGTMVKPLDSIYHQGRNQDWKKIKPFYSADLRITGMTAGKGKAAGMMGRIMVQGRVEDIEALNNNADPCEAFINVKCEVGTGFSDDLRKEMWLNQLDYIGKYVEVQYQEVTKDNSLRFPSFKRFREDKDNGST